MTFIVYFEVYGKKMKTEVEARDEQQAKETVLSKIIFHKIEKDDPEDYVMDFFRKAGLI